jgi:excisionase family DNA binding protein
MQTPTRDGSVLLTPTDAARLAKVSRDTIYRDVDRGSLRALHVGGRLLRIDPIDFRRWLGGGAGDLDEPEPGWRRIGELDPHSGAWVDRPHWHQPQRPW